MTSERKEVLRQIAEEWVHDTLESWWEEYGAWDGYIEDEVLTTEEWDWITQNIILDIKAEILETK